MHDLPLFQTPIARNTDPVTSDLAAAALEKSGDRRNQMQEAAWMVAQHPGMTSIDLAALYHVDRHWLAKRLPDAEKHGLVRKGGSIQSKATRRLAVTWWPAE